MILRFITFFYLSFSLSALDLGLPYQQVVELNDETWMISELSDDDPLALRLVSMVKRESKYLYTFEFYAREAGKHDLLSYIVNEEGQRPQRSLYLEFDSSLEDNFRGELKAYEKSQIKMKSSYSNWLPKFAWLWILGLILIIFTGRKKKVSREINADIELSLAEYFQNKLENIDVNQINKEKWQELEAIFLRFCYERFGLESKNSLEALNELRNISEGNEFLCLLEQGLHSGEEVNTQQLIDKLRIFGSSKQ